MSDNNPKHLAFASGSELVRLEFTPGAYPSHLATEEGLTVLHIHESITAPHKFLELNYYDPDLQEICPREPQPNHVATWDTENKCWTWEHEMLLPAVRSARNQKLNARDWTQVPDSQLNEAERDDWRDYRQALRDITNNCDDITCLDDVVWPTEPTGE